MWPWWLQVKAPTLEKEKNLLFPPLLQWVYEDYSSWIYASGITSKVSRSRPWWLTGGLVWEGLSEARIQPSSSKTQSWTLVCHFPGQQCSSRQGRQKGCVLHEVQTMGFIRAGPWGITAGEYLLWHRLICMATAAASNSRGWWHLSWGFEDIHLNVCIKKITVTEVEILQQV